MLCPVKRRLFSKHISVLCLFINTSGCFLCHFIAFVFNSFFKLPNISWVRLKHVIKNGPTEKKKTKGVISDDLGCHLTVLFELSINPYSARLCLALYTVESKENKSYKTVNKETNNKIVSHEDILDNFKWILYRP